MTDSDRSLLLHGSPEPLPPQVPLRAGLLTLLFEAGDLRYLTLGGREIVRRIYGAVRDREWRTVAGVVSGLRVTPEDDGFLVQYRSEHCDAGIHFIWDARIVGSPDGRVVFDFSGRAVSSFDSNRIGLCLLHPVRGLAGTAALARLTDGSTRQVRFPDRVAIEQPIAGFSDLAGLTTDDGTVEVLLEGDVFETEDQRNWIDASYKTYSTPLSLPRPALVAAGTRLEQRVTVHVRPRGVAEQARPLARHVATAAERRPAAHPMPAIGVALRSGERWPSAASAFAPAHLRVEADLTSSGWQEQVDGATSTLRRAQRPAELALTLGPTSGDALDVFVRQWPAGLPIVRVLAMASGHPTTTGEALEMARSAFQNHPNVAVGSGSRADLYEFHLFPPPAAALHFWAMNPQAHASDATSVMETPEAAEDQVRSVRHRHPGAAIAISPVTLRPRTMPATRGAPHPLQRSLLAASWTLAMAAHLAHAGAGSVTFFEGIDDIISPAGTPYPLFHALADLCECAGARIIAAPRLDGDATVEREGPAVLLLDHGRTATLLAANLSRHTRLLQVPSVFVPESYRLLDERAAPGAAADPLAYRADRRGPHDGTSLELPPFATARLDGRVEDER